MNKKNKFTLNFAVSATLMATMTPLINIPLNADSLVQNKNKKADQEDKQFRAYSNSEFNYDDAETLADFWGLKSPWDAKLKIGTMVLEGKDSKVKKLLKKNKNTSKNKERQQITAFSDSNFSYEDAEEISYFWGLSSPWDAKLKIGSLLLNGQDTQVKQALNERKNQNKQFETFSNSNYSYDDAEILANFWGLPSPWDAKLKIGKNLINGKDSVIKKQLIEAKSK